MKKLKMRQIRMWMIALNGLFLTRNKPWHPDFIPDQTQTCPLCNTGIEGLNHICTNCNNEIISGMTTLTHNDLVKILFTYITHGKKGRYQLRGDAGTSITNSKPSTPVR